jgi:hypothetical protein
LKENGHGLILRYCPGIGLKELRERERERETKKNSVIIVEIRIGSGNHTVSHSKYSDTSPENEKTQELFSQLHLAATHGY